jgi:hypothetical protein
LPELLNASKNLYCFVISDKNPFVVKFRVAPKAFFPALGEVDELDVLQLGLKLLFKSSLLGNLFRRRLQGHIQDQ